MNQTMNQTMNQAINQAQQQRRMIEQVALAIGPELLQQIAFVGGCTTALLLTDALSLEQVRHTEDVDVIVHVLGHVGWAALQKQLRQKGFSDDMQSDGPICAMQLDALRVDFMPDDPAILGFSNKWYADALRTATPYAINARLSIRLVQPAYFVATKLEAYLGRGNNDPLGSQDIEDILTLFDGHATLVDELTQAPALLREYIGTQLQGLLNDRNFEFAVQSASSNDAGREELIFERLMGVVGVY
jgi:predicted nucleotidyltransferase